MLLDPSHIRTQDTKHKSCTMGSEIKNRIGLKWSNNREAISYSCYNSNIHRRRQVRQPVGQVVGHGILRFNLCSHRSLKRGKEINQFMGANNSTHWWSIWKCIFCDGKIKRFYQTNSTLLWGHSSPRTTPIETWNVTNASAGNHQCWRQGWLCSQSWKSWTERYQRQTSMVFTTSHCQQPSKTRDSK